MFSSNSRFGASRRDSLFARPGSISRKATNNAQVVEYLEARQLMSFSVGINFQPASAALPQGYLADSGATYASRGNGYTYGWDTDMSAYTRDRNVNADQRYDTLTLMQLYKAGTWELAVPNGTYRVHAVAGDPSFTDSVYKINAEGTPLINGTPTAANPFVEGTAFVTVTDGRLTLTNAAGSSNNKLCYVDVTQIDRPAVAGTTYLSDLPWASATNGWGPVEKDMSNGEQAAGDGKALTLGGVTYAKGLGVSAPSSITYNLAGKYSQFLADVGIDGEVGAKGSVVFQVLADGKTVYDSGTMTGTTAPKSIAIALAGVSQLTLVVTDAGGGISSDHADWANARLVAASTTTASTDLAQGHPTTTSSVDATTRPGSAATDGNSSTRWSSAYSDSQWIQVDLGGTYNINRVRLNWERASGKSFQIQVSNDGTSWTSIYSTTSGTGGVQDLTGLSGTGRFVRMYGTQRNTGWGYSLYDFNVYGTPAQAPSATVPAAPSGLTATATSASQINLAWTDNSGNETGFKIQRSTDGGATFTQIATVGAGVTTYSNTGLTAGTNYTYRVVATNAVGDSAATANASATTLAVPGAPSGLTATAASASQINLAWTDNSGNETGFKIQRSTDGGATFTQIATVGAGVTTYSNTGLTAGTNYTYRVVATNAVGDSAATANASATTLAVPAAPSGLTATAASASQINLAWSDNSNNETGFKIQRSTDGGTTFTQIATVGAGVTTYSNTGLTAGTAYTYRVVATNAVGDSAATANASATTLAVPAAPSGLTATAASASQINLAWSDNSSNETGFKIQRSTDGGTTFAQIATVGAGVTTYSNTGLTAGTSYTYRVVATNAVGDSAATANASATTPATPTGPIQYSGPITITQGGTYTGNWQSLNASVPAVTIATTQPVTIINANIQSRGDLIKTTVNGARITIRNTRGLGLNSNVAGLQTGRFLHSEYPASVLVQNNYMESTAGMYILGFSGNSAAGNTIKVLNNIARNIDGRYSDGNGGYTTGFRRVQFLQFNAVQNIAGVEIAWNQVVNEPNNSRVEDNINMFESSGTAQSPILIHDNYIQGAYPVNPTTSSFSGGGIMAGDGGNGQSGYLHVYNNVVVGTSNYGIAISAGHDSSIYNNRVISSGLLPDGSHIASENVGVYIWNAYGTSNFTNNTGHDNVIAWAGKTGGRNDCWVPNAASWTNNSALSGTVTLATEANELALWKQRLSTNNVVLGVQ